MPAGIEKTVTFGEDVTLSCPSISYNSFVHDVRWRWRELGSKDIAAAQDLNFARDYIYSPEKGIRTNRSRLEVTSGRGGSKTPGLLHIRPVRTQDTGEFLCFVNSGATPTGSVILKVQGEISISIHIFCPWFVRAKLKSWINTSEDVILSHEIQKDLRFLMRAILRIAPKLLAGLASN